MAKEYYVVHTNGYIEQVTQKDFLEREVEFPNSPTVEYLVTEQTNTEIES